jgi:GR25 family glycosyltransferase involved in LPS biosynthesis
MESSGIGFYFINLDEREDRLKSFKRQFANSNLIITRVSGVSTFDLLAGDKASPPGVVACWKSHQKIYKTLLESDNSFAVVFEDDAVIDKHLIEWLEKIQVDCFKGIDLFQFGYLTPNFTLFHTEFDPVPHKLLNLQKYIGSRLSRVDFLYRNWIRLTRIVALFLLALHSKIEVYLRKSFWKRIKNFKDYCMNERKLRERLGIKYPIIYHSFEAGAHAYVISREFASVMMEFNNPVLLPADLCFMGIARAKNFRILRSSKSMSNQSQSPTSITSRTNV